MILSNVNIGTGPSAGDGDPLRTAFSTINSNFAKIQSNVNALTNSVNSVAGRTGNVVLTVNDIVGFNPSLYPNLALVSGWISSNIATLINGAPGALDTLNELANALGNNASFSTTVTNSLSALTSNAAVQAGLIAGITNGTALFGNIIPGANVTYSLGNVTHQWRDLWVSNSTVYIGGIPVSISNGTLTVNNQPITGASLVNTDGNARITANDGVISYTWTFETDGSIRTPNDLLTIGGYTLLTDNDNELDLNNGNDITIRSNVGNISIGTDWNNNQHTWNFNNDGTNTFPTGLHFKPMGEIEHTSGTLLLQSSSYDIQLSANASGTSTNWQFHQSGNLVLPNGTVIRDTGSSGSTSGLALGNNGFTLDFGSAINDWAIMSGARLIQVQPDDAFNITFGELANWQFSNTGIITFPDSTVQTTAWTGNITGNITVGNSAVNFVANSSGDGNGYSTIELVPDAELNTDQYIIVDPTGGEPGHIHLRAGGTQDASGADLYLGGELTFVRVSDASGIVTVRTTNIGDPNITMNWSFQPDGNLYFPGIGNNRIGESEPGLVVSSSDSVVLQSNNGGVSNEWLFGTNGNLTFPDSTVQTTAWTGTVSYGNTIAIGYNTGTVSQGSKAVAVGSTAGNVSQGTGAVAVGDRSGATSQGNLSVAIGSQAGEQIQGIQATAVGSGAGNYNQGAGTVAIGTNAGAFNQGLRATAIGSLAGSSGQGEYAVAIGNFAGGTNQANNSIIINATGSSLDQTTANSFTVKPIRAASAGNVLYYDPNSGEITYNAASSSYGNAEVATYLPTYSGNISALVNGYEIGYRTVPQVSAGNVTLALSDGGKHYYSTSSAPITLTIPSNANVAFPIGTAITVVNSGTGNITIGKQTEANLYLAGNSTSATRTLTSYGMATLLKTAANQWFINGTGLV